MRIVADPSGNYPIYLVGTSDLFNKKKNWCNNKRCKAYSTAFNNNNSNNLNYDDFSWRAPSWSEGGHGRNASRFLYYYIHAIVIPLKALTASSTLFLSNTVPPPSPTIKVVCHDLIHLSYHSGASSLLISLLGNRLTCPCHLSGFFSFSPLQYSLPLPTLQFWTSQTLLHYLHLPVTIF